MQILVTGAAGFIGFHTCQALLAAGHRVTGLDSFSAYYSPQIKERRTQNLASHRSFTLLRGSIADRDLWQKIITNSTDIDAILHLAAQPGVRYARDNPYEYIESNVMGFVAMLEAARRFPALKRIVYASSSSVYGNSQALPFALDDRADEPLSLYAATKRADEMIAGVYANLYNFDMTGLRFFSVYGPWGRPDMSVWKFTEALMRDSPITLTGGGSIARDLTYIDDIVPSILATLDQPTVEPGQNRLYNLGSSRPVKILTILHELENLIGRKAIINDAPAQPEDGVTTYADSSTAMRDLGFAPHTPLRDGLQAFVNWYREEIHA